MGTASKGRGVFEGLQLEGADVGSTPFVHIYESAVTCLFPSFVLI